MPTSARPTAFLVFCVGVGVLDDPPAIFCVGATLAVASAPPHEAQKAPPTREVLLLYITLSLYRANRYTAPAACNKNIAGRPHRKYQCRVLW